LAGLPEKSRNRGGFRRFGEDWDAELSEDRRWYLRFAGMILMIFGGLLCLAGVFSI
jgi:hypothetical protein